MGSTMDEQNEPHLTRYLPHVAAATFLVAVCPILVVGFLRADGLFQSAILSFVLGMALSLGASYGAGAFWRSRAGAGDLLFGELMVWGWLRRWSIERRLASSVRLLDGVAGTGELGSERRAQLLTQLSAGLEARDSYTHGHSRRVTRYAAMIAKRMGLSKREAAKVRAAAALHDVGKLNTPRVLLHKPNRLTKAEFDVIKRHPGDGAEMVAKLGDAQLTAMVRHHHERLDGAGYPDRLSGDEIPMGARIIAVADTFDAITSTRSYRAANPHKKAMDILAREAGMQLDPAAVRAFDSCYSGRRPLALWVTLTNAPERLVSWLSGGLNSATASVARVMAVSAMTGAVASATVSVRLPTKQVLPSRYAAVSVTADAARRDSQTSRRKLRITPPAPAGLSIVGGRGSQQHRDVGGHRSGSGGGPRPSKPRGVLPGTGGRVPSGRGARLLPRTGGGVPPASASRGAGASPGPGVGAPPGAGGRVHPAKGGRVHPGKGGGGPPGLGGGLPPGLGGDLPPGLGGDLPPGLGGDLPPGLGGGHG